MSHTRSLMLVVLVAISASACSFFPKGDTTTVTLRVEAPNGGAPSGGADIGPTLTRRLELAGFEDVAIETADAQNLKLTVSGVHDQREFEGLVGFGRLAFRKVVDSTLARAEPEGMGMPGAQPPPATVTPSQADVLAKLGPAAAVANRLTGPPTDPAVLADLAPFGTLTPAEVAALPPHIQFAVPLISCPTLAARPAGVIDDPAATVVACDQQSKYLLDPAKVQGTDIKDARASIAPTTGSWMVELAFTPAGQTTWTALTREAVDPAACRTPTDGHCQVAIVVDNRVVSAPSIQGVITGGAQIDGGFTAATARGLAAQIAGGVVAYRLTIIDVSVTVTK